MILKAKIIFDKDDDGIEREIEINDTQLEYILKSCPDINTLFGFLETIENKENPTKPKKEDKEEILDWEKEIHGLEEYTGLDLSQLIITLRAIVKKIY